MFAFLDQVRPTTWRVLALAIVASVGLSLLWNSVLSSRLVRETFPNESASRLILVTLINVLDLLVIVGIVVFRVGRLRPCDVRWNVPAVGRATWVTLGFWVAMQPGLALYMWHQGQELQWNDAWNRLGPGYLLGTLVSQLLGNALLEETLFRGFLLPQFYLQASGVCRKGVALALALLASQILFTLMHLPSQVFLQSLSAARILEGQVENLLIGLTAGAVYLVTRNLFVAVGLHSLWNQPARLLLVPFAPGVKLVWFSLVAILLVAWLLAQRLNGRSSDRREPSP